VDVQEQTAVENTWTQEMD